MDESLCKEGMRSLFIGDRKRALSQLAWKYDIERHAYDMWIWGGTAKRSDKLVTTPIRVHRMHVPSIMGRTNAWQFVLVRRHKACLRCRSKNGEVSFSNIARSEFYILRPLLYRLNTSCLVI